MHDDISQSGVSVPDSGGSARATPGQGVVRDLMGGRSRVLSTPLGKGGKFLGAAVPDAERSKSLGAAAPQLQAQKSFRSAVPSPGEEFKSLDPAVKLQRAASLGPLDKQRKSPGLAVSQAQAGESYGPAVLQRKGTTNYGAALEAGSLKPQKPQMPVGKDNSKSPASVQEQSARGYGSILQNQGAQSYGRARDVPDEMKIKHLGFLASEAQRVQSLGPQVPVAKESKSPGPATPQGQGGKSYQLPLSQSQGAKSYGVSPPQGQRAKNYLSAGSDLQGIKDLGPVAGKESQNFGSAAFNAQGVESYRPVIPDGKGTKNIAAVSAGRQASNSYGPYGQEAKTLPRVEPDVTGSKSLGSPMQSGRNTQAANNKGKGLTFFSHVNVPVCFISTPVIPLSVSNWDGDFCLTLVS